MAKGNGWNKHEKLVLSELKRHSDDIKELHNDLKAMGDALLDKLIPISNDIASLKVKAGIWGTMGGVLGTVVALGAYVLAK